MPIVQSDEQPEVSAVVVNWNAGDVIRACVQSLATTTTVAVEVVVVDNASSDGSAQAVVAAVPGTRLIANPDNRGLAAANNQGIAATTAPFVLISNPDVIYEAGAVEALVAMMQRHPRAGWVVGRMVWPDGTLQASVGDLPTLRDAVRGRQAIRSDRSVDAGFWWDGWAHDEERRAGHTLEACYLVRRQAIAEVGLQDERFFLDWEGPDWAERMIAGGWEIWFTPQAQVRHLSGVTLRKATYRWILRSHTGMYRYFAKRSHPILRPALAGLFAARGGIKLLGERLRGDLYQQAHPGGDVTEPDLP